jgi:hypothetical protein
MPAPAHYEVRVLGRVGPAACHAFGDFAVQVEPADTVLSGTLDQAALHGLFARVRVLGLELVDVRRVVSNPLATASRAAPGPDTGSLRRGCGFVGSATASIARDIFGVIATPPQ